VPVSDAMHDICFCRGQLSQERTLPLQFIAAITSGRRAPDKVHLLHDEREHIVVMW